MTTVRATGLEGGHTSVRGSLAEGKTVAVPLYRHQVALDYTRVELELFYTATNHWDVIARLPWERKALSASFAPVNPASAADLASMQRNIDIHHRPGVMEGMSDASILGRRRSTGVFRRGDALAVSAGVSLPTGRTVENPYTAVSRVHPHSHIQFGSGSVDPLLELSYIAPVRVSASAGIFLSAHVPLYENSKTFKAAPEASLAVSVMRSVNERVSVRAQAMTYLQRYGYWGGVRDENMTGLQSTGAGIGADFRVAGITLSMDASYPLAQRTLLPGDTFERGATFVVGVSGRPR